MEKVVRGGEGVPSQSASLSFRSSRNSTAHRQWSQASTEDNVVEPVTPTGGGIGEAMTSRIVCEAVPGLIVFFSGSAAEGFLQTGASSEYRLSSQTTKYKSRSLHTSVRASFSSTAPESFWPAVSHRRCPRVFGWLGVSPSRCFGPSGLRGASKSFK
jgi:hypothetical protein